MSTSRIGSVVKVNMGKLVPKEDTSQPSLSKSSPAGGLPSSHACAAHGSFHSVRRSYAAATPSLRSFIHVLNLLPDHGLTRSWNCCIKRATRKPRKPVFLLFLRRFRRLRLRPAVVFVAWSSPKIVLMLALVLALAQTSALCC